jgi:hypothetical protein
MIFVRYPTPGKVKTRLGAGVGMQRASEIYASFAEHAFQIGEEMQGDGVAVHVFHDSAEGTLTIRNWIGRPGFFISPQEGDDLGQRMLSAFTRVFQEGATRVVIIGSDVPELGVAHVRQSFELLESHDLVIGPSTDGGYFLLGMKEATAALFKNIPWSSSTVLAGTLDRAREEGLSVTLLEPLADIDSPDDYENYLSRTRHSPDGGC